MNWLSKIDVRLYIYSIIINFYYNWMFNNLFSIIIIINIIYFRLLQIAFVFLI